MKYREFWVAEFEDGRQQLHFRKSDPATVFVNKENETVELLNELHVIEKQAYTDLKQQANMLYEAYKYALGFDNPKDCIDHIGKALKTYEDYLAELDKERE